MLIQILSLIFLTLVVMIVLIDVIPLFKDWIGRIHIGRYNDMKIWNEKITEKGIKWMKNIPKVKVTDNTRLTVIDILRGNHTKSAIQSWQEAALLLGMGEYLKNNNDKNVKSGILRFLKSKFDNNGQWKHKSEHVDVAILSYSIMKLDFIETDRYKQALDYTWELIQEHIGTDGTVQYRKFMKNYRYVDTIGFICPFLVAYGTKYHKNECIELALKQISNYEEKGMLTNQYIPFHAYNIDGNIPLGLNGWGRGLGWFAIGLIDTWNELPKENKNKLILEKSVRRFAQVIMCFQQDNGNWNWNVTREESRPDSSTTATLGWFLLNAAKIKDISNECLLCVDKATKYLIKVTRRTGEIDFSQGDTKDSGVYSMHFNILPFTQGFSIRLENVFQNIKVVEKIMIKKLS